MNEKSKKEALAPTNDMGPLEKELIAEAALLDMSAQEIEDLRAKGAADAVAQRKEMIKKRLREMYRQQELSKIDPSEETVKYVPDFPGSNLIHNRVPICGAIYNGVAFENEREQEIPISKYRDLAYFEFMAKKNERGLNLRNRDDLPNGSIKPPRAA